MYFSETMLVGMLKSHIGDREAEQALEGRDGAALAALMENDTDLWTRLSEVSNAELVSYVRLLNSGKSLKSCETVNALMQAVTEEDVMRSVRDGYPMSMPDKALLEREMEGRRAGHAKVREEVHAELRNHRKLRRGILKNWLAAV